MIATFVITQRERKALGRILRAAKYAQWADETRKYAGVNPALYVKYTEAVAQATRVKALVQPDDWEVIDRIPIREETEGPGMY